MNLTTVGRAVRSALKGVRSAMSAIDPRQGGEPWPQEPALSRYRRYRQWCMVFEGAHEELWDPQRSPDSAPYVTVNLSASLTQTVVDRLWGQPPTPSVAETTETPTLPAEGMMEEGTEPPEAPEAEDPRQAVLTAIWEASKLDQHGRMAVETRSWAGDVVLKAFYDMERDEVRVVVLDPSIFEGQWDDLDAEKCREAVIATVLEGDGTDWLFEEVHMPGVIENRLWELSKSSEGLETDQRTRRRIPWEKRPEVLAHLEEVVETGIEVIPVVLIPNRPTINTRPYGRSDYAGGSDSVQRQLNWRRSQTNSILDKHEESMIYGDISWLEEHGKGKVWNCYQNKAIPLQQGEDPPGFVVYPGTTVEGQQEASNLEQDFCKISRVNPESIGLNVAALPPSGRAIKLMQMNTSATIDGHRIVIGPCLRYILSAATKLHAVHVRQAPKAEPLEPGDIELDWSDGLPEDLMENVQLASMIKTSMLPIPDWRLVQLIYPDLSREDAQAMVDEFNETQQAAAEESFAMAQQSAGGSTEIGEGNLEEVAAEEEPANA